MLDMVIECLRGGCRLPAGYGRYTAVVGRGWLVKGGDYLEHTRIARLFEAPTDVLFISS